MKQTRRQFLGHSSLLAGSGLWSGSAFSQAVNGVPVAPSVAAAEAKAPPLPAVGSTLTLPEVKLLDGKQFQPAQAKGRVLVLYWWASTCPFCAQQSPEMQKLWQAELAKGPQGLLMLTLSVDRKPDDALSYMKKKGYTFPAGFVTPEIQRALPKPKGLPITLVLGRDGRVLQAEKGQLFPEDVEQLNRWL